MAVTEKILDPYPEARKTMNATFEAMVDATQVLEQPELTPQQKRELAGIIAETARHLGELAGRLRSF
jgi:hypothetical protein